MVDAGQGSRWWAARATRLSVSELEQVTRAYWDRHKPAPDATVAQRMEWYIERLLPEELCYADEKRKALHEHPCHTLSLLVGHALEPLFQAIGVFRPHRVVLVLNQTYGTQEGEQRGSEMQGWIERWLAPLLPRPLAAIELCVVADRPDAVFHALCEYILPDRQQGLAVIVDITGAKKSMVAGAYLFAAYADIPISYVDFDDYDEVYRRPFGFNCRIGTLTNPYDAFRLREWERVQRMYENYHLVDANEDNRSALLRAAGLDELLLKARLVRLWHAGDEGWIDLWDQDETRAGRCRTLDQEVQHKLYEALVNHQGTDHMRRALQGDLVYDKWLSLTVPAFVKLDIWRESYRARPTADAPRLAHYDQQVGLSGETLTQLRNQAIHMYLSVTQPVAHQAVALARANVEEFERNWAGLAGPLPCSEPTDVECVPWDVLCRLCGVDFLPLASRSGVGASRAN